MIVLVSGATTYPRDEAVGVLVVPRQWNTAVELYPGRWAMDNGAFIGFDEGAFVRMLEKYSGLARRRGGNGCDGATPAGCLFVTAPDFVGDAAATRARWPFWSRLIRGIGFPPAYVAQDGIQSAGDLPWDEFGALFIGGTNAFKDGSIARDLCGVAKARGKWVHWGRVNGRRRYELARKAGADSIDGSGFSIAPNTNIPLVAEWDAGIRQQPELREL